MTPSEAANDALNATLAAVQPLIKCCMKLKEGDPETLRLLDDIARRMAKDLKTHAGDATSFSPQLLSCTAIIWQYSKGGTFQHVPDWSSVADNDPRIKSHLRFEKTVGYPIPAAIEVPSNFELLQAAASADRSPTDTVMLPSRVLAISPTASLTDPDPILTSVTQPKLISLPSTPRDPQISPLLSVPPAAPMKYNLFVATTQKKPGNSKKRKAEDGDTYDHILADAPKLSALPSKPKHKRKKKFLSDDKDNVPTSTIYAKPKRKESLPVTAEKYSDPAVPDSCNKAQDGCFQDAETRPAQWGHDSHIAMPLEHSVRHHPQKCDKCRKLNIPCLVLPDRKFGCMRLACANCDQMKITCAIDSVGVRERLQAETAAVLSNSDKHSGARIPKSRVISQTLAGRSSQKTTPHGSSGLGHKETAYLEAGQQPKDVLPGNTLMQPLPTVSTSEPVPQPEQDDHPAPTNNIDPEPTARHILESIQDLGRRLDLFATNERVEALEARVALVESVFNQRLKALEQRLN
ncbi:uncharacterized protein F5147DRAFT_657699 [Suillus discolor]|uniref:Zn(2)-C6 fungal-type domain-containing protein n=1 Tax=Suillus discolor TaxID=1912936 RepID=A0A9P7JNB3_9AGAM|nr:uncharacterized protein F5147DRAFT_657699 [Suillus discolor]KAG2092285.1 hypothetical protein F5147DRAFT_657699 [Suillus discolor]